MPLKKGERIVFLGDSITAGGAGKGGYITLIRDTIEVKLACMARYTGEARAFPHPRSAEALRATARRWGSVAGMAYAEAFELIRSLRT